MKYIIAVVVLQSPHSNKCFDTVNEFVSPTMFAISIVCNELYEINSLNNERKSFQKDI